MGVGEFRHRVGFFQRAYQSDGYGNQETDFPDEPEFTVAGRVQAKFGGETVLADRLQGQQIFTVTVRQSERTRRVSADWKVKDMKSGLEMAIKSGPVDPNDQRQYFEFLCQSGTADFSYRAKARVFIRYLGGATYERVPEAAVRAIVEAGAGKIVDRDV